jgi:predicted permease
MISRKDFSTALYALSKAKGYAATVVLTLGLTLGTLVAMFNLNYQILAAPLPYADEDQLVVGSTAWLDKDGSVTSPRIMPKVIQQIYAKPSDALSDQALFDYAGFATLRDLAHSPTVQLAYTTPGYMRMYQMPLLHGRSFSADEEVGNHNAVAVISEQIWRSQYLADPTVVGRHISIGNADFRVIGIAAADFIQPAFTGPADNRIDVWLPWDFNAPFHNMPDSNLGSALYLVKLKDPATRHTFEQEIRPQLNSLWQDASAVVTSMAGRSVRFNAEPARLILEGDSRQQTLWMLAGSLVLLLIAAANITNLLLSRSARQQRNMTIQAALGAQRHHLLSQILAELSWLMLAAMVLGLFVAEGAYRLLRSYAADTLPRLSELGFAWPAFVFALLSTLILAFGFAQLISRQLNYRALQQNLQSSGKGSGLQINTTTRQLLIGSQVMLAAVLLVCSAQVLLQSLSQLRSQVGFATDDRYQISIEDIAPAPDSSLPIEQRRAVFRQRKEELMQVRDLLLQHPAVVDASVGSGAPASFNGFSGNWGAYLVSPDNLTDVIEASVTHTDQHFLPLFDITLLQGRNFTAQEISTQAQVVVINQALAEKLQPGGDLVGQQLHSQSGGPVYDIIGISANHNLPEAGFNTERYRTYTTRSLFYGGYLLLQLKPGMQIDKTTLNQALSQVSPHYRAAGIYRIQDNVNLALIRDYLATSVTSALVLLSFLLAAIGIYGVLSYSVQLRRFELGVRMAIGARPATILRQLLGENLKPVCAGLVLAGLLLVALWLGLQHTTLMVELSVGGFALPLLLIVLLTTLTSLISVWGIIRKPATYALQGQ